MVSDLVQEPKHRTVVDGVILHLAVTAIQKFDVSEYGGCELKWWYDKVQGRKEAKRTWHETGDSVDAQIGHYLATGDNVLGQIARPAVPFLPAPGGDLLLQWGLDDRPRPVDETGKHKNYFPPEQSLVRAAGIPLIGFTDILNGREQYLVPIDEYGEHVELRHEPGVVEVEDVKTTSSLTYAKKHDELGRNTQLLGYGKLVEAIVPSATHVRLSHNVSLTSGSPKSIKRSALVQMSEVRSRWSRVDGVAERMKVVAATKNERDVPGNLESCKSFGGCSYREFCWKYKSTNAITRLKQMGLLAGRKSAPNGAPQQQAAPSNGVQQQPPVPQIFQQPQFGGQQAPPQQQYAAPSPQVPPQQYAAPSPQVPPQQYAPPQQQAEPQPPQGHIWAKDAIQGEPYFVNGALTIYLSSANGRQSFLPVVNGVAGGAPMLVDYGFPIIQAPPQTKPAQSVHRDPAAPPPPAPLAQQAPQPQYAPPQGIAAPNFAPGAQQAPPPPPPAAQGEQPKKKTRRTNAQIAADNAAQAQAAGQAAPQGINLFINAVPSGPFTDLSGYVAEAASAVQEQFGLIDIRVAPNDQSPAAFGRWKGLLAQVAKQDPPPAGTYVAFTRGNELTEVVVEALAPLCSQLVRGV